MECPIKIGDGSPTVNPSTIPENAVSDIQQRTNTTAAVALQPINTIPLGEPVISETITLMQGSITIKAAEIPLLGPIEHKISNTTFNKAFYKKLLAYLLNPKGEAPVIQSERDLACVEYCFFQSYSKSELSHLCIISNLLKEQRPDETISKLIFLYVTYKYFEEFFSYDDVQDALMNLTTQITHATYKEFFLIGLDVAKRACRADDEMDMIIHLKGIEPNNPKWDLKAVYYENSHRADFIRSWMRIISNSELLDPIKFIELSKVRELMQSGDYAKGLEAANQFLIQTESQLNEADNIKKRRAINILKVYLLFKLGRRDESKALTQQLRSIPVNYDKNLKYEEKEISALIAENKFEEALSKATEFLKKTKHQSKNPDIANERNLITLGKIRALLNLGRFAECEEFVKKEKNAAPNLIPAMVAAYKGEVSAYNLYLRYFLSEKSVNIHFWIILDFCKLIKNSDVQFHSHFLYLLNRAAQIQPKCLEVWQALFKMVQCVDSNATTQELTEYALRRCEHFDPTNAHIYRYDYAMRQFHRGNLAKSNESADAICGMVIKKTILNDDFIFSLLELLKNQKRMQKSVTFLKELYEKTQSEKILIQYVKVLEETGEMELFYSTLKDHTQKYPNSFEGMLFLGMRLHQDVKIVESLHYCNLALAIRNNDRIAQIFAGMNHALLQNYEAAVDLLSKSGKILSKNPEKLTESYTPILFDCCLEVNQLKKAAAILKESRELIPEILIKKYEEKVALAKEIKQTIAENGKQEKFLNISSKDEIYEFKSLKSELQEISSKASTVQIHSPLPEPIRNSVPRAKIHLQAATKDVASLDSKKKLKEWLNNPALANVCTTDEVIVPIIAPPLSKQETQDVNLTKRLNPKEFERLERARQHLIQMGDLLAQEKDRVTSNPKDPGNFLFPRALMYNVLKFGEALAPTGRNQGEISEEFKKIIQTHVISTKLILSLRHTMRHESQYVDMTKLKGLCQMLKESTVLKNIEAYMQGAKKLELTFYQRTKIAKKQEIKCQRVVDYLAEAQMELERMSAIGGKLLVPDIERELFYQDGLKMALCNVEEAAKQLDLPEDKELREIFYFGNKVAHEMGQGLDPKLYNNEEIKAQRLYDIIRRAELISNRIAKLAQSKR